MSEITCVIGKKIKFPKERYLHIIFRHPELEAKENDVISTLKTADFVRESVYDKNVLLYYKIINKDEYLVVVVKILNGDGFILTAYISNIIKKGEVIWKK